MKKRTLLLLLIFALVCNFSLIYASNSEDVFNVSINDMKKLEFESVVEYEIFTKSFYTIFDLDKKTEIKEIKKSKDSEIRYKIDTVAFEEDYIDAIVSGYIKSNNRIFPFQANGKLEKIVLWSGDEAIVGAMDGQITIKNKTYDIIVGYESNNTREFITTTIYNQQVNTVLVFGTPVISTEDMLKTTELVEETYVNHDILISSDYSIANVNNNDYNNSFIWARRAEGNLINNAGNDTGYTGIQATLYRSDWTKTSKQLQIRVRSYRDSLYNSLKSNPEFLDLKLKEVKTSLDITTGDCRGTRPSRSEAGSGLLKSLVLDYLAFYSFPTWTLDSIFSTAQGYTSVDDNIQKPSITINAGGLHQFNMDTNHVPFFYAVDTPSTNRIVGTFSGTAKYQIVHRSLSFYQNAHASSGFDLVFTQ